MKDGYIWGERVFTAKWQEEHLDRAKQQHKASVNSRYELFEVKPQSGKKKYAITLQIHMSSSFYFKIVQ